MYDLLNRSRNFGQILISILDMIKYFIVINYFIYILLILIQGFNVFNFCQCKYFQFLMKYFLNQNRFIEVLFVYIGWGLIVYFKVLERIFFLRFLGLRDFVILKFCNIMFFCLFLVLVVLCFFQMNIQRKGNISFFSIFVFEICY